MSNVKLVSITPKAEEHIVYCARVSSSQQDNPEIEGLLQYCIRHGHWSIFEQAHMTVEVNTSRAISAQLLRHKSFSFQEFSQRYADAPPAVFLTECRTQGASNRQSSLPTQDPELAEWWSQAQVHAYELASKTYAEALSKGIARECARMVLPLATHTRLYMTGSVRSWIHYLQARITNDTQAEHREVANEIGLIFSQELPLIAKALGWTIVEGAAPAEP
jgi:thymidylate synthase (FAD)